MNNRKIILNADGFGKSNSVNKAVLHGYLEGFLTSASLCANGAAFNPAVNEIIPECPNLGIGVNLNITNGEALTKAFMITNKKGFFNKNFLFYLFSSNNNSILKQIEFEFRTQIETVMNYTNVSHIDSVDNIHTIPKIFDLTLKLASEYNIPFVRSCYEEFYFVNSITKYLNYNYSLNFIKWLISNYLSINNRKLFINSCKVRTNDYFIGILYKNLIDSSVLEYALKSIENEDSVVEISLNPSFSYKQERQYKEFIITKDKDLKDKIQRLGFELTNYKKESNA